MQHDESTEGQYDPLMQALPAYESFAKSIVLEKRGKLTKTQMDVLVGLQYAGKMSMGQMAEYLAVSKEQTSRAVGPLEKKGLVVRSRSSENYRVVEVALTDAGHAFLLAARADIERELARKLAPLSPQDRAQLMEASQTAVDILQKLLPGRIPPPLPKE